MILIFVMMYITGVMLGFVRKSGIRGFRLHWLPRAVLFLKLEKKEIRLHALLFQVANILLFASMLTTYFTMNDNAVATAYNIYKWASFGLFLAVLAVAAIDASIMEKNPQERGKQDEVD